MVLNGGVPDCPPHFELEFQLDKEMLGLDVEAVREKDYSSEAIRQDALLKLQLCLVEELGYTSAYFS